MSLILHQYVECKRANVNLKKCTKMALRSTEWWLQGCVLSLEGYSAGSFGVGGWVGCYIVGVL